MERTKSLSPSKITTYLACPVMYRWTYVDPRGRIYMRAKSYFSFGTSLHTVLQKFYQEGSRGAVVQGSVDAVLHENFIDAGFSTPEELNEAYGEGLAILQAHVASARAIAPTSRTLYVEKSLRLPLGEFDLIGRVDRVEEHDNGALEIIDYKSGAHEYTEEEVANDVAMCSYQLMLKHLHPDRNVFATIIELRTHRETSSEMTADRRQEFATDMQNLGSEILNRDYPEIVPQKKPLCEGCDFLPLCRQHPEFAAS